jgi:hypothetical protein
MSISQNPASVKGIYHVLRSKDKYKYNSAKYDSLSCYKPGNVKEVQWDMGSKLYPEFPLTRSSNFRVSLFCEPSVDALLSWSCSRVLRSALCSSFGVYSGRRTVSLPIISSQQFLPRKPS